MTLKLGMQLQNTNDHNQSNLTSTVLCYFLPKPVAFANPLFD